MIFHKLQHQYDVPQGMNNPFDYEPDEISLEAVSDLQSHLPAEPAEGKMYGVLVAEKDGKIGYLAAYSGQIEWSNENAPNQSMSKMDTSLKNPQILKTRIQLDNQEVTEKNQQNPKLGMCPEQLSTLNSQLSTDFVPAVFDYLQPDGYFKTHEAEISGINHKIAELQKDEAFIQAKEALKALQSEADKAIKEAQERMKAAKAAREERRKAIEKLILNIEEAPSGKETSTEDSLFEKGSSTIEPPSEKAISMEEIEAEEAAMIRESQFLKAEVARTKKSYKAKLEEARKAVEDFEATIWTLKQERKVKSDALQTWLFRQFNFLNAEGESRNLIDIFQTYWMEENSLLKGADIRSAIPSGAGECCEPKLLQYAFLNGYRPIRMAMFWWGPSPKTEIRHHGHFYPACNGKCKPVLRWMLKGIAFCDNLGRGIDTIEVPLEDGVVSKHLMEVGTMKRGSNDKGANQHPLEKDAPNQCTLETSYSNQVSGLTSVANRDGGLEILYSDDDIVVVNKPAGMLSVPGKGNRISVLDIVKAKYPEATGPMMVHRLDMATSGLLVVAKNMEAYISLQKQFAEHSIKKRYRSIVKPEGGETMNANAGLISPTNPTGTKDTEELGGKTPPQGTMNETFTVSWERKTRYQGCAVEMGTQGFIKLPLAPDVNDRPRQMVDHEHGKAAVTEYKVIEVRENGEVEIEFYPHTGRTHQLRVHAAHPDGLNAPMKGDELYGTRADRLYLHAEYIEFTHPGTGKRVRFEKIIDF